TLRLMGDRSSPVVLSGSGAEAFLREPISPAAIPRPSHATPGLGRSCQVERFQATMQEFLREGRRKMLECLLGDPPAPTPRENDSQGSETLPAQMARPGLRADPPHAEHGGRSLAGGDFRDGVA